MDLINQLNESLSYIKSRFKEKIDLAIILGSGLGDFADSLDEKMVFDSKEIPNYPLSTVIGHSGKIVIGKKKGKTILAVQGRAHFYEGYSLDQVTYSIRLMHLLNIKILIVTNAAGGINRSYESGDLVAITDIINFTFKNALVGKNLESFGVRFPDMSEPVSKKLTELAEKCALNCGFALKRGVYLGVLGPQYETPAEIRMMEKLGADLVGMSTVPDIIVAKHCNMDVLGISCVTNLASGMTDNKLTHDEVTEVANKTKLKFTNLINNIIELL